MLYLTCTTITSIDLAHYGVSRAKDWVSVKCGTSKPIDKLLFVQNYIRPEQNYLKVKGSCFYRGNDMFSHFTYVMKRFMTRT